MYTFNPTKTTIIPFPFSGVLIGGFDRKHKVSTNLNFGEIYDATKVLNKSKLFESGIPFPMRGVELFELLRSYTNKPLYLGSAHRSYEWELSKNRSGNSEHLHTAMDFNGEGLNELLREAVDKENELYQKMRSLGVNAFGEYSWGWHLDFRQNKPTNDIYYWTEKKKSSIIGFLMVLFLGFTFFKNKIQYGRR
jgi:hypothetical protein